MKGFKVIAFIFSMVTTHAFAQGIQVPVDLQKQHILLELNSFETTVELLTKEYERSNNPDSLEIRRKAVAGTTIPNDRIEIGDVYGVAIPDKIINWINETIVKSAKADKTKQYTIVDRQTLENYPVDKWRYVLRYKYIFNEGDPLNTGFIFYFFDRLENKELINYEAIDQSTVFYPLFFYTAKTMYPFYDMIRKFSIKKDFEQFFKAL